MENYGRTGGRSKDFGSGRGGFNKGPREMFRAVCDDCGASCQVPFRPTGERPVYCRDCFQDAEDTPSRDFSPRNDRRSDRFEKRMYRATCSDCGNVFELPFQPDGTRPVYCNDCFVTDKPRANASAVDHSKDFERLNAKLDIIIKALENAGLKEKPVVLKALKAVKEEVTEVTEEVAEKVEEKPKKTTRKKAAE